MHQLARMRAIALAVLLLAAPLAYSATIDEFFDRFTAEWVRGNPDLATALRYISGEEQKRL